MQRLGLRSLEPGSLQSNEEAYVYMQNPSWKPHCSRMRFFLMVCNPCMGAVSLHHESAFGTPKSHLYPLSLTSQPGAQEAKKSWVFTKISGQIPGKHEVPIVTYKALLVPRETCRQRGRKTEGQKQGLQNPLRLPAECMDFPVPGKRTILLLKQGENKIQHS